LAGRVGSEISTFATPASNSPASDAGIVHVDTVNINSITRSPFRNTQVEASFNVFITQLSRNLRVAEVVTN
jgi:hypothetical protein